MQSPVLGPYVPIVIVESSDCSVTDLGLVFCVGHFRSQYPLVPGDLPFCEGAVHPHRVSSRRT